ncbi:hypothetical protein BC939DRAFT_294148 [Gamsiella multidivaricata]|uniref:uncharacterized protein n=1 Tax=Gamsiella multidivaricata TaxID=101098 RepID=UPI00221FF3DD|nr:uncharacterized protein BC939DRAFT_294148 [Gamsiella multidivaricata]KAG0368324.1 hypothetical protein BGZ54_002162 [Gamsiella multidivaricata]KAI7818407.1 hypothetical protein BC939DRAFT_294148 [Gamsiella multidivaricata]
MPPKRDRAVATKAKIATSKKTRRAPALFKRSRPSGDSDDDDDSEEEIETAKDYQDAVRRVILTSTTNRYDDTLEQDQLAFAASLMMPATELQQEDIMSMRQDEVVGQSERRIVYSLGTFCLHAIAKDFKHLATKADAAPPVRYDPQQQQTPQRLVRQQEQWERRRRTGAHFRRQVQQLPFYLSIKLFRILKHARPELLSTKLWTSLFFPPDLVDIVGGSDEEPGVVRGNDHITELDLEGLVSSQVTDTAIRSHILGTLQLGPQLERINLNFMDNLTDKVLAQLVSACPRLTRLSLKGCTKAGDLTLANLPQGSLQELNISFVAAPTAKGIKRLILQCRELRVLKMAGLTNVKDAIFLDIERELAVEMKFASAIDDGGDGNELTGPSPLYALQTLKVSSTTLGDRSLKILLNFCGKSLRRLDISATNITRVALIADYCVWEEPSNESDKIKARMAASRHPSGSVYTNLEKLNLTRLKIASADSLLKLFKALPPHSLHTLLLGYISCAQVPFSDSLLYQLCPYLESERASNTDLETSISREEAPPLPAIYPDPFTPAPEVRPEFHLHTLSLFGNAFIGRSIQLDYGLHLLLKRLSPFLKRLELGYTYCRSAILEGLIEPQEETDPGATLLAKRDYFSDNVILEELGLDETHIDDEAALIVSRFRRLNRLSLQNTRIGKEAVEQIVRACPLLASLDLTSCRSIPLLDRRTLLKDVREATATKPGAK